MIVILGYINEIDLIDLMRPELESIYLLKEELKKKKKKNLKKNTEGFPQWKICFLTCVCCCLATCEGIRRRAATLFLHLLLQ